MSGKSFIVLWSLLETGKVVKAVRVVVCEVALGCCCGFFVIVLGEVFWEVKGSADIGLGSGSVS